jgi:DNA repair protein RadC
MNTSVQYKSNFPSHDFVNRLSDLDLLGELIGVEESRQQYQGSLQPFFAEGPATSHTKCAVARELVKRWLGEEMKSREVFADPQAVANYLKVHFYGREYESFVVLYLDAQHRLIDVEEIFRGTLTQTSVYPREIVKSSLRFNASSLVLAHNHPSGVPTPSRADECLTRVLKEALALVDVRVIDHLIIAGNCSLSFAEKGLL